MKRCKLELSKKEKTITFKHKKRVTKRKSVKIVKTFYRFEIYFRDWLERNLDRFNYKPKKINSSCYYFEGITKKIVLMLSSPISEVGLWIRFEDLEDYIPISYVYGESFLPQRGYFDCNRVDENFIFYDSLRELYENEVFEDLIYFCNETFIKENMLYIIKSNDNIRCYIDSKDKNFRLSKSEELLKFSLFEINQTHLRSMIC